MDTVVFSKYKIRCYFVTISFFWEISSVCLSCVL